MFVWKMHLLFFPAFCWYNNKHHVVIIAGVVALIVVTLEFFYFCLSWGLENDFIGLFFDFHIYVYV